MKTFPAALDTAIAQEVTTLAYGWYVLRTDGVEYGFTSLDRDIEIDGVTYLAATGFTPSAIETGAGLDVDDLEVSGILDSPAITEADLLAGLWDNALVRVFVFDYSAAVPEPGPLRIGTLGEVSVKTGRFVAELRGLAQRLQQTTGRVVSAACDADLGDARCGVTLASYTVSGTVTAVSSRRVFNGDTLPITAGGVLTFTSGANNGHAVEVKTLAAPTISLLMPMPYDVAVGDTYSVSAGCDRDPATCRDVFSNLDNFRGFPFLSTTNELSRGPTR